MPLFPCARIIVFDRTKTILVSTERGNFSFPKGKLKIAKGKSKRNKNKNKEFFDGDKNETEVDGAWRELGEETGLTKEHVKLIEEVPIDELSDKGHPSVRYFVGVLVKPHDKITFDKDELAAVGWHDVEEALQLEKFKNARKMVLEQAWNKYKSTISQISEEIGRIKNPLMNTKILPVDYLFP